MGLQMKIKARIPVGRSRALPLALIAVTCLPALTQTNSRESPSAVAQLVRETVANETSPGGDSVKHMFCDHKTSLQGSQTRLYIETRDAVAGMTIAYSGHPLTPQQLKDEEGRLTGLAENPEQLRRKQKAQNEDSERTLRIIKAFPDAFLFKYDGTEPGSSSVGKEGAELIRLKFWPNPTYRPPSHVEDVLVGMSGFMAIDPAQHRIARIDGALFREVSFGWGILGHLDKGGHFFVEQEDVGDGSWEMSRMKLEFTGKVLLFKNLAIKSDERFTNFRRVPSGTTFAQGVTLLKAEQARLAEGGAESAKAESKSR